MTKITLKEFYADDGSPVPGSNPFSFIRLLLGQESDGCDRIETTDGLFITNVTELESHTLPLIEELTSLPTASAQQEEQKDRLLKHMSESLSIIGGMMPTLRISPFAQSRSNLHNILVHLGRADQATAPQLTPDGARDLREFQDLRWIDKSFAAKLFKSVPEFQRNPQNYLDKVLFINSYNPALASKLLDVSLPLILSSYNEETPPLSKAHALSFLKFMVDRAPHRTKVTQSLMAYYVTGDKKSLKDDLAGCFEKKLLSPELIRSFWTPRRFAVKHVKALLASDCGGRRQLMDYYFSNPTNVNVISRDKGLRGYFLQNSSMLQIEDIKKLCPSDYFAQEQARRLHNTNHENVSSNPGAVNPESAIHSAGHSRYSFLHSPREVPVTKPVIPPREASVAKPVIPPRPYPSDRPPLPPRPQVEVKPPLPPRDSYKP